VDACAMSCAEVEKAVVALLDLAANPPGYLTDNVAAVQGILSRLVQAVREEAVLEFARSIESHDRYVADAIRRALASKTAGEE